MTHYKGHKFLYLYFPGQGRKKFFVHRIVADAFIPNPENKNVVDHIDGDKKNNKLENLRWVTGGDNTRLYWEKKQCRMCELYHDRKNTCKLSRILIANLSKLLVANVPDITFVSTPEGKNYFYELYINSK